MESTRHIEAYLMDLNWKKKECSNCGRTYLVEGKERGCQEYKCNENNSFLSFSKKRIPFQLSELISLTTDFFNKSGYKMERGIPVGNVVGNTIFVGAGVQYFERSLFQEEILIQKDLVE
ncbi:hypothetical protein COX97_03240 [Candidatus Pacearchaeota archaeon CG_4_10_14_0_2_um_filter_05_32_18]|nr:MAG: hypothetical protein COX97_03240 [Candidatus Pacearchaeota archaeon CG_4_10_14_0_2_um_filter_05_32_18]